MFILLKLLRFFQSWNDFNEADHWHLTNLWYCQTAGQLQLAISIVQFGVFLFKFPYQQEGIANILVSGPRVLVHYAVHNLPNFIHKYHHTFLQNFCCVCEVSDVTEAENANDLFAWKHRVDFVTLLHIRNNNVAAGFTEAQGEQPSNLGQGLLQHFSLKRRFFLFFHNTLFSHCLLIKFFNGHLIIFFLLRSFEGIFSNSLDFSNHRLNWVYHQAVCSLGDNHATACKDHTHN